MFWERSCLNREVLGKSLDDSEISKSGWFRQRVKVGSCDMKSVRERFVDRVGWRVMWMEKGVKEVYVWRRIENRGVNGTA